MSPRRFRFNRAARFLRAHMRNLGPGMRDAFRARGRALLFAIGPRLDRNRREFRGWSKPLGRKHRLGKIEAEELTGPVRPLSKERWAGGIDAVGSTTLANLLSMTRYGGAVAACGLAGGMDLPTSVAPFILRGVSLIGIDSVMCPLAMRQQAWGRLETDLDQAKIAAMTAEIGLGEVIDAGARVVAGEVRGRIVVKVG